MPQVKKRRSRSGGFQSRARVRVLQALYQWQITADAAEDVLAQFLAEKHDRRETEYFRALFSDITDSVISLDALVAEYLDRPLEQLDPIEHSILWIGLLEFRDHIEVPYRVVINEAVELAKCYGSESSHKYINAVLDRAAPEMRALECKNSS